MKITTVSIIFSLIVLIGTLYNTRVLSLDFSIDKVKLIFDMPSIHDSFVQHQQDARYLPYRIRLIVFNQSIYIYQILRNISSFVSFNNINQTILLANIYPLIYGIVIFYKEKKYRLLIFLSLITGFLAIGINKMVDARASTLFMMPIFCLLIFKGLSRININYYFGLLVFSLMLL